MNSLSESSVNSQIQYRNKSRRNKGFTLVELSIVLIIISLIVSGVLVGQDLIEGAKLRSTVSQINDYNTAVNTFKLKFNGLPGDIVGSTVGLTGDGNSDGLLMGGATANTPAQSVGEPTRFWVHLSAGNLIPGNFTELTTGNNQTISVNFPAAKTGTNGIAAWGSDATGLNYYQIGAVSGTNANVHQFRNQTLSPFEAYNLDSKIDNGIPNSGISVAQGGDTVDTTTTGTPDTTCADSTAGTWNFDTGDAKACQLRIQMTN